MKGKSISGFYGRTHAEASILNLHSFDSFVLLDLIKEVTGDEPQMWGPSIIGYARAYRSEIMRLRERLAEVEALIKK